MPSTWALLSPERRWAYRGVEWYEALGLPCPRCKVASGQACDEEPGNSHCDRYEAFLRADPLIRATIRALCQGAALSNFK